MHRAAFACGTASGLAVKLSHDFVGRHPFSQRMAVIAVASQHVIVWAQRGDSPHSDSLLSYIEMAEAAYLAQAVGFSRFLLEATYEDHLIEKAQKLVALLFVNLAFLLFLLL